MLLRTVLLLLFSLICSAAMAERLNESRVFSMPGSAKYAADFTHFDYARPDAPKGGNITLAAIGTFDNFNRYATRGNPAAGSENLYDSLFVPSDDEAGSLYPLIATSARYTPDFRLAEVHLNPAARFQDGSLVTASDVAFTFRKFMTEGVPQFRLYYRGVTVEAVNPSLVRITLPKASKDMMLSLFRLIVIPEKYWKNHNFGEPAGTPPLSGGPWQITDWKMGQYLVYSRVKNYWAADLPVNRGRFNFDTLRYDYYLDDNVAFEAFKAGAYDFRPEGSAKKWASQYHGRHFSNNAIVKDVRPHTVATDTFWLAFNNEKPLFADRRVREALTLAFDFEWTNKAFFYGAWKRTASYFQNTNYAADKLPDAAEKALLLPFKDKLSPQVFRQVFHPPVTDGSGYPRQHLLKASALLQQAGWHVKQGKLVNQQTGQPFSFELLLLSGENIEWVRPFQHNLSRLGITMRIRQVDSSQFLRRRREGDYDMVRSRYGAMPWPDSSLQILWSSSYINSSWNAPRVKDPVVDALITNILHHQNDEKALLSAGRALDRVLLWNYYMIPLWYSASDRYAYWNKFSMPATSPAYASGIENSWYDSQKAALLPAQHR